MLEDLGNIGDFIGGITVVVTLLYLAYQVRQNTKSTHSASYQAIVSTMTMFSRELAYENERSEIFRKGMMQPDELTISERTRFYLLMTSYFRNFENIHFQYSSKAIPDDVWDGWAYRIASSLKTPGCSLWWQQDQRVYSGRFRKYINEEAMHIEAKPLTLTAELTPNKSLGEDA
jgi:hypothetical protein